MNSAPKDDPSRGHSKPMTPPSVVEEQPEVRPELVTPTPASAKNQAAIEQISQNVTQALVGRLDHLEGLLGQVGAVRASTPKRLHWLAVLWGAVAVMALVALGAITLAALLFLVEANRLATAHAAIDTIRLAEQVVAQRQEHADARAKLEALQQSIDLAADRAKTAAAKFEAADGELRATSAHAEALVKKAGNDVRDAVGTSISQFLDETYVRRVEGVELGQRDAARRFAAIGELIRKSALPERVAVVLLATKTSNPEQARPALEELFRSTPLRWGYDGYELALFRVAEGKVDQEIVPWGRDEVGNEAFRNAWSVDPHAADALDKLTPDDLFKGIGADVHRRCVWIAGRESTPPAGASAWEGVKQHAALISSPSPARLADWERFVGAGGSVVVIHSIKADLPRTLRRFCQPDLPPNPARPPR